MPEEARYIMSMEARERLTIVEVLVAEHIKQCDRRANIAQKLLWIGVASNLAVLGTLLKMVLHL